MEERAICKDTTGNDLKPVALLSENSKLLSDVAGDSTSSEMPEAREETELPRCLGCGKRALEKLSCPTCLKLRVTTSIFCSQSCFKSNWATHKTLHKALAKYVTQVIGQPTQGYESLALGYKENDTSTWLQDADLR